MSASPVLPGALDGIRVLDLSRVLAAPVAAQMLGDFGAEVIKVERPGAGDDSRSYGPAWLRDEKGELTRDSSFYLSANRNKRSIAVDFAKPEGQEIMRELAAWADILVENFLVGTLARSGLDYESVREINPRLIYCSVTGYGQYGRYKHRRGYDSIFQAQGGLMAVTGARDDEPGAGPMRVGPSIVDVVTGYNAAIGILAALYHREKTGEGQHLDVALLDTCVAMQPHGVQGYLVDGNVPPRQGTLGNGGYPSRLFKCADGAIYITSGNNGQHEAICRVLGVPELVDRPEFGTITLRYKHRDEWDAVCVPLLAQWQKADLEAVLLANNVACSAINDYADVYADPYAEERGLKVETEHPYDPDQSLSLVANPIRMSATGTSYRRPPKLGEHTEQVLGEFGFDDDRIAGFKSAGVI